MKVLLVNAGDYGRGGGQIAAYRLHLGLEKPVWIQSPM